MLRIAVCAVITTSLTGCMADQAAKDAATKAYADCTMTAVKRLDDGRSDPSSIAMGVSGACAGQYAQLSDQMIHTMFTEGGQASMKDRMEANELRLATTAVLKFRAAQRDQQR